MQGNTINAENCSWVNDHRFPLLIALSLAFEKRPFSVLLYRFRAARAAFGLSAFHCKVRLL